MRMEMTIAQIMALLIFLVMFVLVVLDKIEKYYVTIGCGILTLTVVFGICMHSPTAILDTLNLEAVITPSFWYTAGSVEEASSGINWSTIVFLAGMMIMVEGMAKAGFFRWLCMRLAKLVKYNPISLFIVFMVMSAFLAMFIDSITVILFLAAVTVELAQLLRFNPVPMILSEVFCANLGGAATMCGDPPNIIVGTSLGYSFFDFVVNTGLICLVALVVIVVYFFLVYRKELTGEKVTAEDIAKMPDPATAITNKRDFAVSVVIFLVAVALLVTHSVTGLTVATIGTFIAIVTLAANVRSCGKILKKVDYNTLLFFVGLFIVVGGLEQTGILELIAEFIGKVSGGNLKLMVAIILWLSALASAFVDNIPFAATMVPIVKSLAATQGVSVDTLAWALSIGTDIGGSATPIGASANVVGTSVAMKNGYPISWGRYCKSAAPATIIVVGISMLIIFARYC